MREKRETEIIVERCLSPHILSPKHMQKGHEEEKEAGRSAERSDVFRRPEMNFRPSPFCTFHCKQNQHIIPDQCSYLPRSRIKSRGEGHHSQPFRSSRKRGRRVCRRGGVGIGHGFFCRVFYTEKYPSGSLSLFSLCLPRVLFFSMMSHTSYTHDLLRSPPSSHAL